MPGCSALLIKKDCNDDESCKWDGTKCIDDKNTTVTATTTIPGCSALLIEKDCKADTTCKWDGKKCNDATEKKASLIQTGEAETMEEGLEERSRIEEGMMLEELGESSSSSSSSIIVWGFVMDDRLN